jgi:hypothetical protein
MSTNSRRQSSRFRASQAPDKENNLQQSNMTLIPDYMNASQHKHLLSANYMLEFCGDDAQLVNGLDVFFSQKDGSNFHQPTYVAHAIRLFSM